ncbi:MAG: cation transporter [Paludibacteraceae bacterium]|nr:cation transporter [Paludibacteraceae bacterium]
MEREKEIYKVTLIGSAGNLLLLTFKFAAGVLGNSAAMIADAVHSLSDFLTDIVVLLFVKVSVRPQDSSHDYGHGKYETLATMLIGLALVGAAIAIIVSGAIQLAHWLSGATIEMPGTLALWAALISILVKEVIYRYTVIKGRKLHSQAMIANAWHHRSDALSSIGAAIGIGGALLLGERWAVLDPIASIAVGGMLMKVAWELLKESLGELTDHSLSPEEVEEIRAILSSHPDVTEPHKLRTRKIGTRKAIEAHIRMDGNLPLREAHEQASALERKLKERFGDDTLVTLHMEPKKNK